MPAADQGVSQDRYQLIPRTLIFLTRGESVLLLKGAPDKRIWAGRYNGVGGHLEKGEDVYTAARRELQEETGLVPDQIRLVGTVTVDAGGDTGISLFVIRGECKAGEPRPSAEGDLEWVAFDKIQEKPLVEDLPTLLPRVLAWKKEDPPFAASYTYDDSDNLVIRFAEE